MRTATALLAIAGCARSDADGGVRLEGDGLVVHVALEPETPRVGENALRIRIEDAVGRPRDDARITAAVTMPAMGSMAAMGGPAELSSEGDGRHRAGFSLAMGSTWQVALEVRLGEATPLRAEGSLTVGSPGLRLAALPAGPGSGSTAHSGDPSAVHPAAHPAEVVLDPARSQTIGITTTAVRRRPLAPELRAVGRVVAAESGFADVTPKVSGFATRVDVAAVGEAVDRGDVLALIFSPELIAAQAEYVEALRSQARAASTSAPDRADALVDAARTRLRRWDLAPQELERLDATLEVLEQIPVRAPISGYVVEKDVVQGGAFGAGERLFRLAPRSPVWIEADVYESGLADARIGAPARISLAHAPGAPIEARVAFVQPVVDATTRTTRLRLEVENRDGRLRPNAYVDVVLAAPAGEALVVPESAVLETGTRSFAFRALGGGRFRPQAIVVGRRSGDEVEVLSGLAEGDEIVRSGTFLVAAESRLRAALEQW